MLDRADTGALVRTERVLVGVPEVGVTDVGVVARAVVCREGELRGEVLSAEEDSLFTAAEAGFLVEGVDMLCVSLHAV
jgi:hypothetical protein